MSDLDNHQLSLYNQDIVQSSVDPRDKIHNLIAKNPGIRYKELTRLVQPQMAF